MLRELILLSSHVENVIAIGSLVIYLRKLSLFDFSFPFVFEWSKTGRLVDVRWKSVYLIYLRLIDQLPVSPFIHVEPSGYLTLIDTHMTHKIPSHYINAADSSFSSFDQL